MSELEKYIRNDQYGIPVRIFTYKLLFHVGIEYQETHEQFKEHYFARKCTNAIKEC